jgi:hypothetical protein
MVAYSMIQQRLEGVISFDSFAKSIQKFFAQRDLFVFHLHGDIAIGLAQRWARNLREKMLPSDLLPESVYRLCPRHGLPLVTVDIG